MIFLRNRRCKYITVKWLICVAVDHVLWMTDLCPVVSVVVDHVLWVDGGPVPHGQWEPQAGFHHGDGFLGAGHPWNTADVEHPQGGTCHWPTLWYRNVFVREVIVQSCSIRIFGKAYANKKIN